MKNIRFLYPKGCVKALTMSYDDGVIEDVKLIKIFNRYGIKGTFNLNAGIMGTPKRLPSTEISEVYKGHEVSCHSYTHPFMERIPQTAMLNEIIESRKGLEALVKRPVLGMAYPMGTYNTEVKNALRAGGIAYSRTVNTTGKFGLPDDWLEWHPTCHHRENILAKAEVFKSFPHTFSLLYVWGHSYEFENNGNWELIEEFCATMSGYENIWYATNIEIYNYVEALRRLVFSADCSMVVNSSALDLWLTVDGATIKIPSGETVNL
ncbi:MAG: polysaccharide deacetylase family protein [Victivallaceae bacterium]|nr:polysaccharide deacetylase family protein [Victivallaceae bacterium]